MIDSEKNDRHIEERKEEKIAMVGPSIAYLLLVLWELLSRTEIIDSRFFPPPAMRTASKRSGTLHEAASSFLCEHKLDPHHLWFYCGNDSWNLTRLAHGKPYCPLKSFFSRSSWR